MVFDGDNYASTYQFVITSLNCGLNYFVQVSAINVAGEGLLYSESLWLGHASSEPINPILVSVTPDLQLTIGWDAPTSDNCLTILSYTVTKDGIDHTTDINPSLTSFTDNITIGGSIGQIITYTVKAVNYAGESASSQELKVTVGQVPNAPTDLRVKQYSSLTSMKVQWD
jgi:hypothetical protein